MELIAPLEHVSAASLTAVLIVAAAGLLTGVAPSPLPMYLMVIGSVAARTAESARARRGLLFALGFVLGLASANALIGGLFGFFGQAVITAPLAALYFFCLSAFYAGLAPAIDWLLLK